MEHNYGTYSIMFIWSVPHVTSSPSSLTTPVIIIHSLIHSFSKDLWSIYYVPPTPCYSRICSTWTPKAMSRLPACAFQLPGPPPSISTLTQPTWKTPSSARHKSGATSSLSSLPWPPGRSGHSTSLSYSKHGLPLSVHTTWHLPVHLSVFTSTHLTPWGDGLYLSKSS